MVSIIKVTDELIKSKDGQKNIQQMTKDEKKGYIHGILDAYNLLFSLNDKKIKPLTATETVLKQESHTNRG